MLIPGIPTVERDSDHSKSAQGGVIYIVHSIRYVRIGSTIALPGTRDAFTARMDYYLGKSIEIGEFAVTHVGGEEE